MKAFQQIYLYFKFTLGFDFSEETKIMQINVSKYWFYGGC